jgi:prepilin-type N-terminal cleavage/methylation domain-containing protein
MKRSLAGYARSQSGYTLVEVIISVAIAAILMTALTSVILTSARAGSIATSRIEASSEIRSFELRAYDDFAGSVMPDPATCSSPPAACSIVLSGTRASNSINPTLVPYEVTYTWDGTVGDSLDRQIAGNSEHVANDVSAFSWFLDGTAPNQSVVVSLTVTVQSYSQSQTLRFYPRVNP